MRKFKVGDVVILKEEGNLSAMIGATATVVGYEIQDKQEYVTLKWDKTNPKHGKQCDGGYYERQFELLKEKNMDEVKISKENIKKAYEAGCDDVKRTLKNLFPDVLVGTKKEQLIFNEVKMSYSSSYFILTLCKDGITDEIIQPNTAKIDDGKLWLPFSLCGFRNFEVEIDRNGNPLFYSKK